MLQAADAVAFEIRQVLNLALGSYSKLRAQFRDLADPGKVFSTSSTMKDQLLHIVSHHTPGEPSSCTDVMAEIATRKNNILFYKSGR